MHNWGPNIFLARLPAGIALRRDPPPIPRLGPDAVLCLPWPSRADVRAAWRLCSLCDSDRILPGKPFRLGTERCQVDSLAADRFMAHGFQLPALLSARGSTALSRPRKPAPRRKPSLSVARTPVHLPRPSPPSCPTFNGLRDKTHEAVRTCEGEGLAGRGRVAQSRQSRALLAALNWACRRTRSPRSAPPTPGRRPRTVGASRELAAAGRRPGVSGIKWPRSRCWRPT
jgi:hypothetical protein